MAADQDEQFAEDKQAQAFLAEAEKFFAGEGTKLYSVWESIEGRGNPQEYYTFNIFYFSPDT